MQHLKKPNIYLTETTTTLAPVCFRITAFADRSVRNINPESKAQQRRLRQQLRAERKSSAPSRETQKAAAQRLFSPSIHQLHK